MYTNMHSVRARRSVALLGVLLALASGSAAARAQAPVPKAPPPAGPRTIVGVVTDTSDVAFLDSVQVTINALTRRTFSAGDGKFRFDNVKPGKYQVSARRIGYQPQVATVVVGDSGGAVRFALMPLAFSLPTIVTSASQLGLSGVIGDTAYDILEGAEVRTIGGSRITRTDSLGKFHLDLPPGRYAIRVSKEGYATNMMSVTIPDDSGRKIVSWLAPADRGLNNRMTAALLDMEHRRNMALAPYSKVYTHEDITKLKFEDLHQISVAGSGLMLEDGCMAYVDGGAGPQVPLWSLSASELEMVEVYNAKPPHNFATPSKLPPPKLKRIDQDPCKDVKIYAWLRR